MNSRITRRRNDRRHGFTLIEVLLVLLILVILASLTITMLTGTRQRAQEDAARALVGEMKTPIEVFEMHVGRYPTTAEGLGALIRCPDGLSDPSKWSGPYLKLNEFPTDPWERPLQYCSPGRYNTDSYDVWSWGPDGVDGTNDDIGNWKK
jgi:general secretion pathway protein G